MKVHGIEGERGGMDSSLKHSLAVLCNDLVFEASKNKLCT